MSRVAVVGLGLIGGSLALALRARGWDRDSKVRESARGRGMTVPESLEEAVADAQIIVAAVPTVDVPPLLAELARTAPRAVLTDTASLKRPVAAAAEFLGREIRFVGGHPMAGARGHGLEAARPDLFRSRPWAVVPTARSDEAVLAAVEEMAREVGARPIRLDAERHDRLMTWVSHLPHAAASALARAVVRGASGADLAEIAGPGLHDTTRIAGRRLPLALELALANPEALAEAIESVRAELAELADALRRGGPEAVAAFFEEARGARRSLDSDASRG